MKIRSFALFALFFTGVSLAPSSAFVAISVGFAPPALPVYVQPPCPIDGHIWTPGYWAYGDVGYYWVPGVWVRPPRVGVLWTPGYWGWSRGAYVFNEGYWGSRIGFYGGVNYGFGYFGSGFCGGGWYGDRYRYNTAYARVNTTVIHNTYVNKTVINNYATKSRASFNGPGGVTRKATVQEQSATRAPHVPPTGEQRKVRNVAIKNPAFHATNNNGRPKVAALRSSGQIAQLPSAGRTQSPGEQGAKNRQQQAKASASPGVSANSAKNQVRPANSAATPSDMRPGKSRDQVKRGAPVQGAAEPGGLRRAHEAIPNRAPQNRMQPRERQLQKNTPQGRKGQPDAGAPEKRKRANGDS